MEEIHWEIPRISDEPIQLTVNNGDQLFIVGANGSGKSSLMQRLTVDAGDKKIKWIAAHRQTWFDSGNIDFTPAARQEYNRDTPQVQRPIMKLAGEISDLAIPNLNAVLFDLVAKENTINESIVHHVRNEDASQAYELSTKLPSLIYQINELLNHGGLTVTLEKNSNQNLLARHPQEEPFSIAEMSDAERSAVIIAAHVITAESWNSIPD